MFSIGNYDIVPNAKIFGLNVDSKLKFSTHILQICEKAGIQVHICLDCHMFLTNLSKYYYTLVSLNATLIIVLLYDIFVVKLINTYKIENNQEKAVRFTTTDFTSSYNNLSVKCNKTLLYVIRIRKFLEIAYKISEVIWQ